MDLASKGWAVFGLRGSGKSWFVKSVLQSTPDHLIYDPLKEHTGYNKYTPSDRTSIEELEKVIEGPVIKGIKVVEDNKTLFPTRRVGETWKPELFVIDEANRYIYPKPTRLPKPVADLVDYGRHWFVSFGVVARSGLGNTVRNLPPHHFVAFSHGSEITVHAPIAAPHHPTQT